MTEPRYFSAIQRIELFSRSGGHCQSCGVPITLTDFHADHITPWSKGGKTTLANGQALCRTCNIKKSSTMQIPYQMHLPAGWTLRNWQEEFVNRYLTSAIQQISKPRLRSTLLSFTPSGAGKSLAQCLVARTLLEQGYIDQVIFAFLQSCCVSRWWMTPVRLASISMQTIGPQWVHGDCHHLCPARSRLKGDGEHG